MLSDVWVYTKTSKVMMALLLIAVALLAWQNWQLGLLLFIVVAGVLVWVKRCDMQQEKKLREYLNDVSAGVSAGTVYAVKNLPIGIAVVDDKKKLVWTNNVFRAWIGDAQEGTSFREIVQGPKISKIWEKTGWFDCHAGNTLYRVFHKYLPAGEDNENPLMVCYFMDRTDVEKAVRESEEARPVFCLIRIDNASEVTQDMTDVERSALLSDVAEKVLSYFSAHDGFIKQYATNDFVACISHKALEEMMEEKFKLLDEVREIKSVNRMPVTLSIGVVESADTFARQYEEAQLSLDLALGRGGDQAVVRTGTEVKHFGGKAQTAASNTRVRARVIAQALKEIIEASDTVLVMGHGHEDFDCLGSAVGISYLARMSGRECHVVLSRQGDTAKKMIDAIEASGLADGLLIDESKAKNLITESTLLVVVDTHIPGMVAAPSLLEKVQKKVIVDHHRRAQTIIQSPLLTYMEPSSSSACELVTELAQYYGGDEELNTLESSCLYAGIVVDTKNFSVQTSVRTFDAASYLRRCGARVDLVRKLFSESLDFIRVKSQVLSTLEQVDGYMVFAECPEGTEESQIVAGQLADFLITVKDIRASFLFYHTEKGVGISARSDGSLNMQIVMEALGGGGHLTVSGAQLKDDVTIRQAKDIIIEEVRKQEKEDKK